MCIFYDRFLVILSQVIAYVCIECMAALVIGRWSLTPARAIFTSSKEQPDEEMTMFGPFKKFARALRVPSVEEREMAYLNGSNDRFDLEYRQRQVDRGAFRNR